MTPQSALIIKTRSLAAIAEIHKITEQLPEAEYAEVRRAIGLVLGSIEVDILGPVYAKYPALDDLTTPSSHL